MPACSIHFVQGIIKYHSSRSITRWAEVFPYQFISLWNRLKLATRSRGGLAAILDRTLLSYSPRFMEPEDSLLLHKSPTLAHNLNKIYRVHDLPSHSLKIHFSMIPPSTPRSYKWSLSLILTRWNRVWTSPFFHMWYTTRPSLFLLNHPVYIWGGVHIIKLLFMLFLHSPVTLFPF